MQEEQQETTCPFTLLIVGWPTASFLISATVEHDRGRTDMSADTVAKLEAELESLHATLEGMGKNSRGATDIFGRKFSVPVNAEHKATQDPLCVTLCNGSNPHMRGAQRRRHALAP